MMRGPLILVFVQTGCPACTEYMQRFNRIAPVYHRRGVPIQVGDLARGGERSTQLADHYKVQATPTTIGITRAGDVVRLEGAVETKRIQQMFDTLG